MSFPGLTGPVIQGSTLMERMRLPDDETRESKLIKAQEMSMQRVRRGRQNPLERGFTSATNCGKSIGPPDPVKDRAFPIS